MGRRHFSDFLGRIEKPALRPVVLAVCLLCLCAITRTADAAAPYFIGAKLNDAGVAEISTASDAMYEALKKAAAKDPTIRCKPCYRKGESGAAYRFQFDRDGTFTIYHPLDYHISLARDVTFKSGTTQSEVLAALKEATAGTSSFYIDEFANGSKIVVKNSSNKNMRYFTFDFETSGGGASQEAQIDDLSTAVKEALADISKTYTANYSYHVSFGTVAGYKKSVQTVQNEVIGYLKKYHAYNSLVSADMAVSSVAVMISAHTNDATQYTTYVESALDGPPLGGLTITGTTTRLDSLSLADSNWSLEPYDRLYIGGFDDSKVSQLLDWLSDEDALAVISTAGTDTTSKGYLSISGTASFTAGTTSDEDNGAIVVGLAQNESGKILISGSNARITVNGDIDVGEYGHGTIEVGNGATITAGGVYLGYRAGSFGAVALGGSGTSLNYSDEFFVGYAGTAALSVADGAEVFGDADNDSYLCAGYNSGSDGAIEITGPNSQIQLYEGILTIGSAGSGALQITAGGSLTSGDAYIGEEYGSHGAVLVDGAGSRLTLSGNVWVGIEGTAALSVQNSAAASCGYLIVAGYQGSTGTLSLSGASSTIAVENDLMIGGLGASDGDTPNRDDWQNGGAALVRMSGGSLSVAQTIWIGGSSNMLLSGGTLSAANLEIMRGGIVQTSGAALDIAGEISVDGLLNSVDPLTLASGNSLTGGGVVISPQTTFLSGAVLAPGHSAGTLTFVGDVRLDAGSRTQIELISNDACDKIVVSGELRCGGALAFSGLDSRSPSWGYCFASAGSITGDFDSIDTSALPVAPKKIIFADQWALVKFKDLADVAQTRNSQRLAAVFDDAIDAGQSNSLINQVVAVGDDRAANQALNQMNGELYASLSVLGIQNTTNLYRTIADRLRPNAMPDAGAYSFDDSPAQIQNVSFRDNRLADWFSPKDTAWSGWVVGYGLGGSAYACADSLGVNFSVGETIAAIERTIDCETRFGAFYGYGAARAASQNMSQSADVGSHHAGAFLSRQADEDYYIISGGFGYDKYDSRRLIAFNSAGETATGRHHGWQSAAYVERGLTLGSPQFSLQPYGAMQYVYLRQNAFVESGASPFDLDVSTQDLHSLRGMLGGKLTRQFGRPDEKTSAFSFRAIWMHEFLRDADGLVTMGFADEALPSFFVRSVDLGRDWAVLGPAWTYTVNRRLSLSANYDVQFNHCQAFHVGGGAVQLSW